MPSALVEWIREGLSGIEDLKNVPEDCRQVGVISQVIWSADNKKKRYPARILMISDNMETLEAAELAFNKKKNEETLSSKRKRGRPAQSDSASTADVNRALGERVQIPLELEKASTKIKRQRRETSNVVKNAQTAFDNALIDKAKKALQFQRKTASPEPAKTANNEDYFEGDSDCDPQNVESDDNVACFRDSKPLSVLGKMRKCNCDVCMILIKFDTDSGRTFTKALFSIYEVESNQGIRYLELVKIPPGVGKVELTKGKGVFIRVSDKNQIKVDFYDKPNQIVKETLFSLYGSDVFRSGAVTARGNRSGTYGIAPIVLSAVQGFVNRNVSQNNKMQQVDLVNLINKRASDWRSGKEEQKTAQSKKRSKPSSTVVSDYFDQLAESMENIGRTDESTATRSTTTVRSTTSSLSPLGDIESLDTTCPMTNSSAPIPVKDVSLSTQPVPSPSRRLTEVGQVPPARRTGTEPMTPSKNLQVGAGDRPSPMRPSYREPVYFPYNSQNQGTYPAHHPHPMMGPFYPYPYPGYPTPPFPNNSTLQTAPPAYSSNDTWFASGERSE